VILLDTSVLIDALSDPRASFPTLRTLIEGGETVALTTVVLYEWLRGPRTLDELLDQEDLLPTRTAIAFTPGDAELSAILYRSVRRARTREIDIAIAACAIRRSAELWTLNPADFGDIPGLRLWRSR
jgi:predicted nucleic acid-binding protein